MTFSGLRSRWTMPAAWAAASAEASWPAMAAAVATGRRRSGVAGQELGQGRAVVEGHGQKTHAFVLADLVDGADVRMVEGGCGLGLAAEADLVGGARGAPVMEELDRHLAAQLDVLGEIDDAHAAAAERPEQPVMRRSAGPRQAPRPAAARRAPGRRARGAGGDGQRGAAGQAAAVELRVRPAAGGAEERLHQAPSGRPPRSSRAARWRASSFCR